MLRCQTINQAIGTSLGPWDMDKLGEWETYICTFAQDFPRMQKETAELEKVQAAWREKNGFRSYLKTRR